MVWTKEQKSEYDKERMKRPEVRQHRKEWWKRFYQEHQKEFKERAKNWAREHYDLVKKRSRDYYLLHREKIIEREKNYVKTHPEVRKKAYKNYHKNHPDRERKWAKEHQEQRREYDKQYRLEHYKPHPRKKLTLEELKIHKQLYYQTHKEECHQRAKKWNHNHLEKMKEIHRKWNAEHPEKVKEMRRIGHAKNKAKRRRLGHLFLNIPFEGADGHHIDRIHIVWIPHNLHHSIYHNVWTGQGMKEINTKVWEWLNAQSGSIQMNIDILYEQIRRCR